MSKIFDIHNLNIDDYTVSHENTIDKYEYSDYVSPITIDNRLNWLKKHADVSQTACKILSKTHTQLERYIAVIKVINTNKEYVNLSKRVYIRQYIGDKNYTMFLVIEPIDNNWVQLEQEIVNFLMSNHDFDVEILYSIIIRVEEES